MMTGNIGLIIFYPEEAKEVIDLCQMGQKNLPQSLHINRLKYVLGLTIATTIVEIKLNEMKKENHNSNFRDETELGSVPQ